MTPSQLQQYLDAYDNMPRSNVPLSLKEEGFLRSLRMLAQAKGLSDVSQPIQNYIKTMPEVSDDTNTQTAVEKLIRVLSGTADSSILLSNETTLSTTADSNNELKADSEPGNPIEWLEQLIKEVTNRLGGSYTIKKIRSHLELTLSGSVPMKYSIFMALVSCGVIGKSDILRESDIDNDRRIQLYETNLQAVMQRTKALPFVKQFLQELGLDVEMGTKTCAQSLSENEAFKNNNNLILVDKYNMSLAFATALSECGEMLIVLPLTVKISTYNDDLMALLEFYYAHKLVNLYGRDQIRKTFIPETRASGCRHESVLNLTQLEVLKVFFERLAYFSQYSGIPATQLDELTMQSITDDIYSAIKEDTNLFKENARDNLCEFEVQAHYPQVRQKSTSDQSTMIDVFTKHTKDFCNRALIPGPAMFLDDTPFITTFKQIQEEIFKQKTYQSWPNFKESYNYDENCCTPRSPIPMYYYPRAMAQAVRTGQRARLGTQSWEHTLGLDWLGKIANRDLYGSSASQHYLDFYTENDAYYLLDSCVSCINLCLDEAGCTDDHVRRLLNALHVSDASMQRLQMTIAGQSYFNRFQIKLLLLPIVLNGLCKEGLLANYASLVHQRHPWVNIAVVNKEPQFSTDLSKWQREMSRWCNMKIDGLDWTVGGTPATDKKRDSQTTSQKLGFFAGGASAEQQRATAAVARSSVHMGSNG